MAVCNDLEENVYTKNKLLTTLSSERVLVINESAKED